MFSDRITFSGWHPSRSNAVVNNILTIIFDDGIGIVVILNTVVSVFSDGFGDDTFVIINVLNDAVVVVIDIIFVRVVVVIIVVIIIIVVG